MDRLPAAVLQHFESLGDNCEFGFVQRSNGYEAGGLLRWSISPLDNLIHCLDTNFKDFYCFENLEPSAPDMVRDIATGLMFHTAMRSLEGRFLLGEEHRREIYAEERRKMDYMLDKLIRRLHQPGTIFVYKRNIGVSDDEALRLHTSLNGFSEHILLLVRSTEELEKRGTVEWSSYGFLVGYIDRFAPYSNADQISIKIWNDILTKAIECQDRHPATQ